MSPKRYVRYAQCVMVLAVLFLAVTAQAQTGVSYVGGQLLLSDGVGAGSVGGFGFYLSDRVIVWTPQIENEKAHDGKNYDFFLAGTTVLNPGLWDRLNMGWFLTACVGTGGSEDQVNYFTTSTTLGPYFVLHKENRWNLYLGGGYSYIEGAGGYSLQLGLSRKL